MWVPIIRSWALTRGFALHPGTRNRYEIRDTRTQHRPASRQVNDHGRVSGTHTALDRRSLRWFGISACTATPEDLPPSLAQHGSCRRSSTSSSSLPFRTHVGAHNSVVGADQGFRAPSWDQESVHDAVHEDSASARIATGQRPRPSFRHPQDPQLQIPGLSLPELVHFRALSPRRTQTQNKTQGQ